MATDTYTYRFRRCPNCGNQDRAYLSNNGCKDTDPSFTMLCTAPVSEQVSTIEANLLTEEEQAEVKRTGLMECGMQWEPNGILPDDEEVV